MIFDNEIMEDIEFMDIDESMHYRVLKRDDVSKLQEDDIALLCSALSVSRTAAVVLLQHYAWNCQKAQDAWFDNEDGVRKLVGLTNKPAAEVRKSGEFDDEDGVPKLVGLTNKPAAEVRKSGEFDDEDGVRKLVGLTNKPAAEVRKSGQFDDEDGVRKLVGLTNKPAAEVRKSGELPVCGICFEFYVFDKKFERLADFCGHRFCSACLEIYVSTAIFDGPGCLFLRCPDPSCRAVVVEDMVNLLVSDKYKNRYKELLCNSYVDNNKRIKWCPAPDCKYAIQHRLGSESYDVTCDCSRSFCWNCGEESHRPVRCKTVKKWMEKNSSGLDSMAWIIANSKQCPECNLAIQKSQGCMHMTCQPPCRYEFCWICLGPWSQHDTIACNIYRNIAEKRKKVRKKAKKYSARYAHYYERWDANHHSRERALADLHELRTKKLQQLEEKLCQTTERLKFILEAWEQIAECRRVLKWTYAYGYYMPRKESLKKELFEYLQGEAEVALERLHDCAENTLKKYFEPNGETHEFDTKFRTKLVDLTRVTRNYFENFVKGVANGLSEVKGSIAEGIRTIGLNES